MKKILVIFILSLITWYGYDKYKENALLETPAIPSAEDTSLVKPTLSPVENNEPTEQPVSKDNYQCDGRSYCAQMTSCAEATFFHNNCPKTKRMDGNKNGIPCEKQWCNQISTLNYD